MGSDSGRGIKRARPRRGAQIKENEGLSLTVNPVARAARAWTAVEVDMENVAKVRSKISKSFKEREGFSLTWLPFVARATVDALLANPPVNASLSEDLNDVTYHHYVNLGISVAAEHLPSPYHSGVQP